MKNLIISVLIMFSLMAPSAWAGSSANNNTKDQQFVKDEESAITRATAAWAASINEQKPEETVGMYADQFYLYATLQNKINTYDALMEYFVKLSKNTNMAVRFDKQNIRVYGPVAVDSGLYTFSYDDDKGKKIEIPARYTFVYLLTPEGWEIVDHHSSALPE